jgi:steroid delta-isomerase-like uncharacterized protein
VRELYDAFNAGEIERAASLASDDFRGLDVATGQAFEGPAGLAGWLTWFKTALPDASTELIDVIGDGPLFATVRVGRGTNTGPLMMPSGEVPPTGRSIEIEVAEVLRFEDGKIRELRAYYDSATLMRQLGLLPEETAAV